MLINRIAPKTSVRPAATMNSTPAEVRMPTVSRMTVRMSSSAGRAGDGDLVERCGEHGRRLPQRQAIGRVRGARHGADVLRYLRLVIAGADGQIAADRGHGRTGERVGHLAAVET